MFSKKTEQPKAFTNNIVKLLRLMWNENRILASILFILILFLGLIPAAELWTIGYAIDELTILIENKIDIESFHFMPLLILLLLMLLRNWGRLLSEGIQDYLRNKVSGKLQKDILEKASHISIDFYDKEESYNELQRANDGLKQRFINVYEDVIQSLQLLITIIAYIVTLTVGHWLLGPTILFGAVLSILLKLKRAQKKFDFDYEILTPLNRWKGYFANLLISKKVAKEIRIFNSSSYIKRKWLEYQEIYARSIEKDEGQEIKYALLIDLLLNIILLGVCIYFALEVIQSSISIGYYMILVQVVIRLQQDTEGMMNLYRSIYQEGLFTNNLFNFLALECDYSNQNEKVKFDDFESQINFDNVWFKYPDSNNWILKGISFDIKKGETVSFIGQNGVGKSTIIKLLLGLYKPQKGKITIDGISLDELNLNSLRERMSVIFQDYINYELTVKESIGIGDIENISSINKVIKASEESGASSFIENLKDNYETYLSKAFGGTELSGGQWQKIALARTFMKKPQILILDEPTSALDPLAEIALFKRFKKLSATQTTILISHRLGTAKLADKIIVMDNGQKVEEGKHADLIKNNQLYNHLYQTQLNTLKINDVGENHA